MESLLYIYFIISILLCQVNFTFFNKKEDTQIPRYKKTEEQKGKNSNNTKEKVERFNFEEIQARAEDYGEYLNHEDGTYEEVEIPDRVNVLTAGVDVQDNRLEVEIVGWAKG